MKIYVVFSENGEGMSEAFAWFLDLASAKEHATSQYKNSWWEIMECLPGEFSDGVEVAHSENRSDAR
jgi:hypothetical protein